MREKTLDIAIIGHFGGTENFLDGQTIKTKTLYEELKKTTNWGIDIVDTYYKARQPLKLFFDTLNCLLTRRNIIVLLSQNGMRFYLPLLYFFAKVFHTRVYHDVIGGNLDNYVKQYPKFKKYLNSFKTNWVETQGLKNRLESVGVINCDVIPNFKDIEIIDPEEVEYVEPFRFCTFSRVMREKGIEDAINAIESINRDSGNKRCTLDIYGQIDEFYEDEFRDIIKCSSDAIKYCGVVQYDKSTDVLKDYYALLFPTYWNGEGFPGTIIDAFSAGIPVIASDWNCNSEIVDDGVNGIVYPNERITNLKSAVEDSIINRDRIAEIKKNCICSANSYRPDRYIKRIIDEIYFQNKN